MKIGDIEFPELSIEIILQKLEAANNPDAFKMACWQFIMYVQQRALTAEDSRIMKIFLNPSFKSTVRKNFLRAYYQLLDLPANNAEHRRLYDICCSLNVGGRGDGLAAAAHACTMFRKMRATKKRTYELEIANRLREAAVKNPSESYFLAEQMRPIIPSLPKFFHDPLLIFPPSYYCSVPDDLNLLKIGVSLGCLGAAYEYLIRYYSQPRPENPKSILDELANIANPRFVLTGYNYQELCRATTINNTIRRLPTIPE